MKVYKRSAIRRIPIYITIIISCIFILSSCSVPSPSQPPPAAPVTESPPPPPEMPPAEFRVTSLAVTPIVAEPGQPVTVEVKVENVGGTAGSNRLALTVNGAEEEVRDVRIAPGKTETTIFTLAKDASGMYEIKVADFSETLRVRQAGAFPHINNTYAAWPGKTTTSDFLWHPKQEPTPQLKSLAMYDIIGIPYTMAYYAPESIRQLRMLNPQLKIMALFWVGESDLADVKAVQSTHESWFLHYANKPGSSTPPEQRRITFMEKLWLMNPASEWSTYVPNYVHDKIMASGLFDGVFFDMILDMVYQSGNEVGGLDVNNIDIDNDGIADNPEVVKREYNNGMTQILKLTRELCGPEMIINCNCEWSADSPYYTYANGNCQEDALGAWTWSNHTFAEVWEIYQRNMQQPLPPAKVHIILSDPDGQRFDDFKPDLPTAVLQKMRYGLTITLLDDGYFGFDAGAPWHCQVWWFPEYDANLGLAKGDAQKRSDGTWMREFENGVVVANPTSSTSTIEFADAYKDVTTGIEGTQFVVPPQDGRIFVLTH
jgi:hypothetical protein